MDKTLNRRFWRFSQCHSCGTYSVLSRSHSVAAIVHTLNKDKYGTIQFVKCTKRIKRNLPDYFLVCYRNISNTVYTVDVFRTLLNSWFLKKHCKLCCVCQVLSRTTWFVTHLVIALIVLTASQVQAALPVSSLLWRIQTRKNWRRRTGFVSEMITVTHSSLPAQRLCNYYTSIS